jgi:hypothetical protein
MLVATEPYGNSDFEYPEVVLNPFKASQVSVISQEDAFKEKNEEEEATEEETENGISAPIPDPATIKPESIKPNELIQQTQAPIAPAVKKKETPMAEIQLERVEPPKVNFAPIPVNTAPAGQ